MPEARVMVADWVKGRLNYVSLDEGSFLRSDSGARESVRLLQQYEDDRAEMVLRLQGFGRFITGRWMFIFWVFCVLVGIAAVALIEMPAPGYLWVFFGVQFLPLLFCILTLLSYTNQKRVFTAEWVKNNLPLRSTPGAIRDVISEYDPFLATAIKTQEEDQFQRQERF